MVQIVNSLFQEYLPAGLADPRQSLLTGDDTIQPTVEPTIQPTIKTVPVDEIQDVPTYEAQPLAKTLSAPIVKEQPVAQTTTPTKIVDPIDYVDPNVSGFDTSNIDLSQLQNLDLSGLDTEALNNLTYQDVTQSLTGIAPSPTSPEGWQALYNQYGQSIAGGMPEDVDINDRPYFYNYQLGEAILGYQGTPEEFRAAVGLPETFSIYDNPQAGISTESAQNAYQALTGAADPMEALSQYYGVELQAATPNERSVYTNAELYGTTPENMAEFQSVISPVLQQVIPYIQMTQGLRYDDALEYAYKHDPMVAALYNKYGVDLFRQTSDGSTYFYDPFSGLEARTVEVKDTSFRDVGLALTGAALTAIVGPQIGAALGGTQTANAIGSAISSGLSTAATGGDVSDVLRSMATAGILNYGAAELAGNVDLQETLNQVGEEFGFGTTVEAIQESGSFVPSALTEQGLTGGSFTGSLAQVGAEAGKGLGDVLAAIGQSIIDPSWTPMDLGDANIIINFANEAAGNPELRDSLSVGLDVLREMAQTAATVYRENTGETPELNVDLGIEFDPEQQTPIEVDTETGVTTTGLPQPQITTEEVTSENTVAAQLDEAIQNETNQGVRESLITEYENLTGQDYGTVEYVRPETTDTTETVQSQDVLGETTDGMLTGGTTQPAVDTTQPPAQVSQAQQTATDILSHATGGGEYREDYDYNNDGRVTSSDALMALKLSGVSKEDLFGYVETIFGSTVDDITTSLDSIDNLEEQITTGQEIIGTLTDERDSLSGQVVTLEGQLADAQDAADAAVAAGDANAAELQATADAIQEQLDATTADLTSANETITGLESQLGTTQETLATTQEQLANTQEERDVAQTEVGNLTTLLQTANTEATDLQGKLDTATADNTELTTNLENANSTVDTLTGQLETVNEDLASLRDEYTTAVLENADNVDELEQAIKDKEGEVAGLEGDLADANAAIDDLEGQISDNEEEISGLEGSLSDALATIAGLEGDLSTSQAETEAAIAAGEAAAEAAGEAGYETGYGEGEGVGRGVGAGLGLGLGMLAGQRSGGGGMFTPPKATAFMQQLPTDLTKVQLTPPTNAKDYLAELIARLQA